MFWPAMAPPPSGEGSSPNPILTFLPFVLMIVVVWFLLIRPQRKRQKEHQAMLTQLSKGDRVVTNSGMFGTIVGMSDNTVTLRVGDDSRSETKIEFLKSAIAGKVDAR
ncbi:MAG: preprotein translocase subunit YajC [Candidatus Zixiibacteriota bacterium]